MAAEHGMISPFEHTQVRENENGRVISYGTSSYGYDVRCADEFKIFTNINSAIVDPKNFDPTSFVDVQSDVCIIPPIRLHSQEQWNIFVFHVMYSPFAWVNPRMHDAALL